MCPPAGHGHEPGSDCLQGHPTSNQGEPTGKQPQPRASPSYLWEREHGVPGEPARGHPRQLSPPPAPTGCPGVPSWQKPPWMGSRHRTELPAGLLLTRPGTGRPAPPFPVTGAAGAGRCRRRRSAADPSPGQCPGPAPRGPGGAAAAAGTGSGTGTGTARSGAAAAAAPWPPRARRSGRCNMSRPW